MDLLEYQGKRLFQDNGLKCPEGFVISSPDELDGHDIEFPVVVKVQVPIGKRGKGGGITFAEDEKGLRSCINKMLGSTFSGHLVEKVLIEQKVSIKDELYLAVTLDVVNESPVLIISSEGGMDIAQEAEPRKGLLRLVEELGLLEGVGQPRVLGREKSIPGA